MRAECLILPPCSSQTLIVVEAFVSNAWLWRYKLAANSSPVVSAVILSGAKDLSQNH
jgi:hypothetical protein